MARTKLTEENEVEPRPGSGLASLVDGGRRAQAEDDLAEGVVTLKLTWPEELFSPVQYNTFKIGGFEVVLKPKAGETIDDMVARGEAMLERVGRRQFENKLAGFLERLRTAAERARPQKK